MLAIMQVALDATFFSLLIFGAFKHGVGLN